MRIISKFKDYYDTVQAYGQDSKLLYIRKQEEIKNYKFDSLIIKIIEEAPVPNWGNLEGEFCIIGFCGKLYPFYCIRRKVNIKYSEITEIKTFNYSAYTISEQVNLSKDKDITDIYFPVLKDKKRRTNWYSRQFNFENVSKLFDDYKGIKHDKIFQDLKTPIFIIPKFKRNSIFGLNYDRDVSLIKNCSLKDYNFFSVIDPYSAFQEIEMYISGVLGVGQPNLVEISNEDMRDKKGFDNMSFKTYSPGKKRKKKSK